jgi:hypothetical protein
MSEEITSLSIQVRKARVVQGTTHLPTCEFLQDAVITRLILGKNAVNMWTEFGWFRIQYYCEFCDIADDTDNREFLQPL